MLWLEYVYRVDDVVFDLCYYFCVEVEVFKFVFDERIFLSVIA